MMAPNALPISESISRVNTVEELRRAVRSWRVERRSVALVPTMGALHDGHLALVEEAGRRSARVIVSIFVNPIQFGPDEDLTDYPRDTTADVAKLAAMGVDLVFTPPVAEMYPDGFATTVTVAGVTEGLCGDFRPKHFPGVATAVTKLLIQCRPDAAVFGEKDYQQLVVIRRLARDLDLPVDIVGVPTVREDDGLALSSRNAYLSTHEREIAGVLNKALAAAAARLALGENTAGVLEQSILHLTESGFAAVEYFELRDAETLLPVSSLDRPARLLAAVWIGGTRLIDNVPVSRRP